MQPGVTFRNHMWKSLTLPTFLSYLCTKGDTKLSSIVLLFYEDFDEDIIFTIFRLSLKLMTSQQQIIMAAYLKVKFDNFSNNPIMDM